MLNKVSVDEPEQRQCRCRSKQHTNAAHYFTVSTISCKYSQILKTSYSFR